MLAGAEAAALSDDRKYPIAVTVSMASGISVVSTMANVTKHSLTQLVHYERTGIDASPRESELLARQVESMRKLADRWAELVGS